MELHTCPVSQCGNGNSRGAPEVEFHYAMSVEFYESAEFQHGIVELHMDLRNSMEAHHLSSFFSEQWEGPSADTASVVTHGSFVPPAVSLQGAGLSQQNTTLQDIQLSEFSCVSGPRDTTNHSH